MPIPSGKRPWPWAKALSRLREATDVACLIVHSGERILNDLVVVLGQLRRPKLDGQLVELAGEAERHLVVVVVDRRARVDADVEGLVDRHEERNGVRDLPGWRLPLPSTFSTPVPPLPKPGPS